MSSVWRAAIAGALASIACAAPAGAFTPPEVFVRAQDAHTHEPAGDWIPLAAAPQFAYVGGVQVGYRLQASGEPNEFQRAALSFAEVPDGQPTQPYNTPPYCVGKAGTVGTIEPVGAEVQFEGTGRYAVTVSVGPGAGGADGCLTGPSTTGSFTVDLTVSPELAGEPLAFRATPLARDAFVGVRAADPPGGVAETRCALDATMGPDGSVAGRLLMPDPDDVRGTFNESAFTRPGAWTCVSRGVAEGADDAFAAMPFGTPWSAPLRFEVHSDFRRVRGALLARRSRHPRLRFWAEFPEAVAGARGKLVLRRFARCRRSRAVLRKVAAHRSRFDARGRVEFRIRRPRRDGWYAAALSFAGSRYVRAGNDPQPVLLMSFRRQMEFVSPKDFPRC